MKLNSPLAHPIKGVRSPLTWARTYAFLVVPSLVLLILLWLPFGFSIGALIEEWDVLSYFTSSGVFFLVRC